MSVSCVIVLLRCIDLETCAFSGTNVIAIRLLYPEISLQETVHVVAAKC